MVAFLYSWCFQKAAVSGYAELERNSLHWGILACPYPTTTPQHLQACPSRKPWGLMALSQGGTPLGSDRMRIGQLAFLPSAARLPEPSHDVPNSAALDVTGHTSTLGRHSPSIWRPGWTVQRALTKSCLLLDSSSRGSILLGPHASLQDIEEEGQACLCSCHIRRRVSLI